MRNDATSLSRPAMLQSRRSAIPPSGRRGLHWGTSADGGRGTILRCVISALIRRILLTDFYRTKVLEGWPLASYPSIRSAQSRIGGSSQEGRRNARATHGCNLHPGAYCKRLLPATWPADSLRASSLACARCVAASQTLISEWPL